MSKRIAFDQLPDMSTWSPKLIGKWLTEEVRIAYPDFIDRLFVHVERSYPGRVWNLWLGEPGGGSIWYGICNSKSKDVVRAFQNLCTRAEKSGAWKWQRESVSSEVAS